MVAAAAVLICLIGGFFRRRKHGAAGLREDARNGDMNKMEKALRELTEMDDLAAGDSPVHGLSPFAKLITTVVYIVTVVSFDKYDLAGLAAMVIFPALLFSVSGISVRTALYKMRIVLPLVMAVGVLNPFFDRQVLMRVGNVGVSEVSSRC